MPRPAAALAALVAVASAAKVGYFESSTCPDPKGFESCYKDADEAWADCVKENCEDQNIDCINLCSCIQNLSQLDCAGQSCWNQVYSCEYQETVADLTANCLDPKYDSIPFWPPPDNAGAGCSCNVGKLVMSQAVTLGELENKCGVELLESNPSPDVIRDAGPACQCCSSSAILSAIYNICPKTQPGLIGLNEWSDAIAILDKNWGQCGAYLEAYPCVDTLGMSPPAGDKGELYVDGDFPANDTETLYNTGTITSPVSGATYSYTYFDGVTHVVTVASANARPTGSSGGNAADNDEGDSEDGNEGGDDDEEGDGGSSDDNSSSGGSDSGDGGSGATSLSPWLMFATWPLAGMAMVLVWL